MEAVINSILRICFVFTITVVYMSYYLPAFLKIVLE